MAQVIGFLHDRPTLSSQLLALSSNPPVAGFWGKNQQMEALKKQIKMANECKHLKLEYFESQNKELSILNALK